MTAILALDTASESCSAGLWVDGEILVERTDQPRGHSRLLLPMIDQLLGHFSMVPAQLSAIGFTAGPGSFTGLRIGFGVVQGLAFACDLPVVPVSTLETMAAVAARRHDLSTGDLILPALDARMGEIYWGLYQYENGALAEVRADAVGRPESVPALLPSVLAAGVGSGWQRYDLVPGSEAVIDPQLEPDAFDLLHLALAVYTSGGAQPVDAVEPRYLRNEVSWKKHQKLRPMPAEGM